MEEIINNLDESINLSEIFNIYFKNMIIKELENYYHLYESKI